jgi:hypothetical protein
MGASGEETADELEIGADTGGAAVEERDEDERDERGGVAEVALLFVRLFWVSCDPPPAVVGCGLDLLALLLPVPPSSCSPR